MTKRLKSIVLHSTRVLISKKKNTAWLVTISSSKVGKVIAIYGGFCSLKMMKCRTRQTTDPQKFKNCQQLFSLFLLVEAEAVEVEAEAIGVEAEAVNEIAASTSMVPRSNAKL